jgi:hypothetical protein
VVDGLKSAGKEEVATQLQSNPTPSACVEAQKTLAEEMEQNPTFRQQAETVLKESAPQDWDWAQSLSYQQGQPIDWNEYFRQSLVKDDLLNHPAMKEYRAEQAETFRESYNISDDEYEYVRTGRCPIGGELIFAKYYRPVAPDWTKGEVLPPEGPSYVPAIIYFGFYHYLPKGAFGQCTENPEHTWWVYATGKAMD